jgi:hypothetical protein
MRFTSVGPNQLRINREQYAALTIGEKIAHNKKILESKNLSVNARQRIQNRQRELLQHYGGESIILTGHGDEFCLCTERTAETVESSPALIKTRLVNFDRVWAVAFTQPCALNPARTHYTYKSTP